jgi:hypothetical protein
MSVSSDLPTGSTAALPSPVPMRMATNHGSRTTAAVSIWKTAQITADQRRIRTRLPRTARYPMGTDSTRTTATCRPTMRPRTVLEMSNSSRMAGAITANTARSSSSTKLRANRAASG